MKNKNLNIITLLSALMLLLPSLCKSHEIKEDTIEKIHIRTRQYAKRQMKWFDNQSFHNIFDMDNIGVNDIVDKLVEMN